MPAVSAAAILLARRGPVDRLRATWDRAETTYITKISIISASHVLKPLEWQNSCPKLTDLVRLGVGLDLGDGDTTSSRGVDADDLGVGEARVLVGRLVEEVSLHNYLVRNVQRVVGFSIFHTIRAVSCPNSIRPPFPLQSYRLSNPLQIPSIETAPRPTLPDPSL